VGGDLVSVELSPDDRAIFRRAHALFGEANTILTFVAGYLRDKYGLPPTARIFPDGTLDLGAAGAIDGAVREEVSV
jgi:hypothetical protein